jgi:hypothetical protein
MSLEQERPTSRLHRADMQTPRRLDLDREDGAHLSVSAANSRADRSARFWQRSLEQPLAKANWVAESRCVIF